MVLAFKAAPSTRRAGQGIHSEPRASGSPCPSRLVCPVAGGRQTVKPKIQMHEKEGKLTLAPSRGQSGYRGPRCRRESECQTAAPRWGGRRFGTTMTAGREPVEVPARGHFEGTVWGSGRRAGAGRLRVRGPVGGLGTSAVQRLGGDWEDGAEPGGLRGRAGRRALRDGQRRVRP